MATTITAVRPLLVAGSLVAVGATASVDDALARQLVFNGDATATFADRGYAPDNFITVAAGVATLAGGAAAANVTVSGVKVGDIIVATIADNLANNDVSLLEAKAAANAIALLFNEDPTAGVKVSYIVRRPLG